MKKMAYAALAAGLITGILILVTLFQVMGFTISDRVIMESSQGDYIKYNSNDPVYIKHYQTKTATKLKLHCVNSRED